MRPADQQQQYRLGEKKCGQNDSEMCHQLFAKPKHVSRIFPVVFCASSIFTGDWLWTIGAFGPVFGQERHSENPSKLIYNFGWSRSVDCDASSTNGVSSFFFCCSSSCSQRHRHKHQHGTLGFRSVCVMQVIIIITAFNACRPRSQL